MNWNQLVAISILIVGTCLVFHPDYKRMKFSIEHGFKPTRLQTVWMWSMAFGLMNFILGLFFMMWNLHHE